MTKSLYRSSFFSSAELTQLHCEGFLVGKSKREKRGRKERKEKEGKRTWADFSIIMVGLRRKRERGRKDVEKC